VRSEGFYVNEKSTDTSWDRTSNLRGPPIQVQRVKKCKSTALALNSWTPTHGKLEIAANGALPVAMQTFVKRLHILPAFRDLFLVLNIRGTVRKCVYIMYDLVPKESTVMVSTCEELVAERFIMFPALKRRLNSHKFQSDSEMEAAVTQWMITQDTDFRCWGV